MTETKTTQRKPTWEWMFYLSLAFLLFGYSTLSFAVDTDASGQGGLFDIATNITGNLGAIADLVGAAAYVVGIGFCLAGMVKFKAHRDNPTQVPLSAPIVLLAVGAGLVFLPSIINTAGSTIFGGDSAGKIAGGKGGSGIDNIDGLSN